LKNYLCLLGALTVPSLLSFMTPNYVDSVLIKPGDPRLKSEFITYESPKGGGKISSFIAANRDEKKLPGIIVVHENRTESLY
jgi:carboxymethylenebutenolidase